ncbi:hypothetical protein A2276_03385 [candidate division WOR-1 bacterium RIFOXYA12_FULL_43_27]|uniref:DUF2344 domain-containing protein n=1 Tax=candidate division WOR-1 bacterium RIFOXYC2_FULL_46_14 TaxID=1802587 RepID=A0A1F4U7A8_UNCSA|nr:MAG: hypothetical protein A2276_03385 [candidate division WOR-1 bacterium RIFOXYA12_FULL_43_27]OGC19256.1 MAG: hypothetical protein A2292_00950 [candidate division WOR-1 bacterium RIFOXYB2_FULL_46_45]OGC30245.1 MAG: hypothetical protein A2232_00950 [candidate division WOR-1 bacterium RIFOXYA2_FULL_46_56]OGC40846.1 MAG: hypothetical protein A2438_00950 [candidate division WOR-1 bacterium RIFOXYC2_FULL_46_14]
MGLYTINITYTKGEEVKFISHLDLIRVFERAIRRANLPIAYSQGFNPRMKISYGQALKVGATSAGEEAKLTFEEEMSHKEVVDRLNAVLPKGIKLLYNV